MLIFSWIFLMNALVIGGPLMHQQNENAEKGCHEEKTITITVFRNGKEIPVPVDSAGFNDLYNEMECFAVNSDNGYEFVLSKTQAAGLKKRGVTVELKYAPPKSLAIQFLDRSIMIEKILIPLIGSPFPEAAVFVLESATEAIPFSFANTKQGKDHLRKLVMRY